MGHLRRPSLRTAVRISIALTFVLVGLLHGGSTPAHADQTITFAEFAVGTPISIQYAEEGVSIPQTPVAHVSNHTANTTPVNNYPQIIDRSFTTDPSSFTTTGSDGQALMAPTCQCEEIYGVGPLTINFSRPQHHISLDAGFLRTEHTGAARRLQLTSWSLSGGSPQILSSDFTAPIGPDNHITHHLSVDTTQGIDRITVDQWSPNSGSEDLDFAVDNLTFDNPASGTEFPGIIPSITITRPANGATLYNTVGTEVQGFVWTPHFGPGWSLVAKIYPPGSSTPVVQRGVGTFSGAVPLLHVRRIFVALTEGGVNGIQLELHDPSNAVIASDRVNVTVPTRPSAVDVAPRAMEIQQAINWPLIYPATALTNTTKTMQYAGEPLVAGKKTVVRLYGTVVGSSTAVSYVGATLDGYDQAGHVLPASPLSPQLGPTGAPDARITVDPADPLITQRLHPEKSWNFVLPLSWTTVGTIRLVGRVNPDAEVPDPNRGDDSLQVTNMQFFPTSTLEIRPRFFTGPVSAPFTQPHASDYPGASDTAFTDGFVNSLLPVPDGAPQVQVPLDATFTSCPVGTGTGNCDSGDQLAFFDHLMGKAIDLWNSDNAGHAFDFHAPTAPYVIDEAQINQTTANINPNGVQGESDVPSHWITAEVGNSGDTLHESIHGLGMSHASNAHGEAMGGGNESWPFCHGEIALICAGDPDTTYVSTGASSPNRPFGFNTAPSGGTLSTWNLSQDTPGSNTAIIKDPIAHAPYAWLEPTPGCTPSSLNPAPTPPANSDTTMHYHEVISYGSSENPNCQTLGSWISTINYCRTFFTFSGLHAPDGSNGFDWCKTNSGYLSASQLAGLGHHAALLRRIAHSAARAHATAQSLLVHGTFDQNFQLQAISLHPSTSPAGPSPKSGKYQADLLTQSGKTVKQFFDLTPVSTHPGAPEESFSLSLPYPNDATELAILDPANNAIIKLPRPTWKPTLKILSPTGGKAACRGLKLSWSFSNAGYATQGDGTSTLYSVAVSTDSGKTFETLDVDLAQPELAVPSGCRPGGKLIFRVTASDGFDTASVTSSPIFLPQAPPTVTITSPANKLVVQPGIPVTFHGQAQDAQGNLLSGGALRWVSDHDGVIGTGDTLDTSDLSIGKHEITLTAKAPSGLSSSASIVVVVSHRSSGSVTKGP